MTAPSASPRRKINLSTLFAGQYLGIREVADEVWLVSFMHYDLGFFDQTEDRLEPVADNPFAPKLLPMSPEWTHLIMPLYILRST